MAESTRMTAGEVVDKLMGEEVATSCANRWPGCAAS
jgi:hypothetical protein